MVTGGRTRPDHFYRQSAVIPYRRRDGELQILLISNRKRTRWIVPKGIVEPGLSPALSAAKEAWEEAGICGEVASAAVGEYSYRKWGGLCHATVFPMRVDSEAELWPEQETRERRWCSVPEAARRVRRKGLAELIRRTAALPSVAAEEIS